VPALTVLGCRRSYKVLAVFFNLKLDTILGSLVQSFCITHGKLIPLSEKRYQLPVRNTKWLKNGKLRRAILSAFYNISQRNFGILLILWCSLKLCWNFCLDLSRSKFCSLGNRSVQATLNSIPTYSFCSIKIYTQNFHLQTASASEYNIHWKLFLALLEVPAGFLGAPVSLRATT
jgi:hypothetical protein